MYEYTIELKNGEIIPSESLYKSAKAAVIAAARLLKHMNISRLDVDFFDVRSVARFN